MSKNPKAKSILCQLIKRSKLCCEQSFGITYSYLQYILRTLYCYVVVLYLFKIIQGIRIGLYLLLLRASELLMLRFQVPSSDESDPSWLDPQLEPQLELKDFQLGSTLDLLHSAQNLYFSSKIKKQVYFTIWIFFPYFTFIFTLFSIFFVVNNPFSS